MEGEASAAGVMASVRVKKASTAFFFFMDAVRSQVKEEMPDLTMGQIGSEIGKRWRALSSEAKKVYENKAVVDKQRFDSEVAEDCVFPFARVRRLLLGGGAVPAVSREAALTAGKAAELFVAAFAKDAVSTAQRRGANRTVAGADVATTARGVLPWSAVLQFDFPEGSYAAAAAAAGGAEPPVSAHSSTPVPVASGGMAAFLAAAPKVAGHAALFASAPPTAPPPSSRTGGGKGGQHGAASDKSSVVEAMSDSEGEGEGGGTHTAGAATSTGDAVLDAVLAKRRKGGKGGKKDPPARKKKGVVDAPGGSGGGARKKKGVLDAPGGSGGGLSGFLKGGQSKHDAAAAAFAAVQDRDFTAQGKKVKGGKGGKKRGRAGCVEGGEGGADSDDSLVGGLRYDDEMDVRLEEVRAAHGKRRKKRTGPAARSRAAKAEAAAAFNAAVMAGELDGEEEEEEGGGQAAAVSATAAEEDGDVIWPTGM